MYNCPRNDPVLAFQIINITYNIYYRNREFLKSIRRSYSKYLKLIRHLKIPNFFLRF